MNTAAFAEGYRAYLRGDSLSMCFTAKCVREWAMGWLDAAADAEARAMILQFPAA